MYNKEKILNNYPNTDNTLETKLSPLYKQRHKAELKVLCVISGVFNAIWLWDSRLQHFLAHTSLSQKFQELRWPSRTND